MGFKPDINGTDGYLKHLSEGISQIGDKTYKKVDASKSASSIIRLGLILLIQVAIVGAIIYRLTESNPWIITVANIISVIAVIGIFSQNRSASIKMPWIILILVIPVGGILLYLYVGQDYRTKKTRRRYAELDAILYPNLSQNDEELHRLECLDLGVANISRYIRKATGYPVYQQGDVVYYDNATASFDALKEEIIKAEKYVFMEYHAIENSIAFKELLEILKRKVDEGVEVRIFYDDFGSYTFINYNFTREMESYRIKCRAFNRVFPILNIFNNYRDHRKITVVDGKTAFTGGYNIANEYFNITHPYGYWKDSGVKITGEAVTSFVKMFLEMWNLQSDEGEFKSKDFTYYLPDSQTKTRETKGFIQPYDDNPLDDEDVGEDVYMNLINNAKKYIWFTTPYLIITDEMNSALTLAAKRGVDVRIITPGIPDKRLVYSITRSYYKRLVEAGVKIYEFSPGFIHAKQCVSDDKIAVCGTINLDFRSLYHHFEDAVMMYNCKAVVDIKCDFEETFPVCRRITIDDIRKQSLPKRAFNQVIRLFSSLM